MKRNTRINRTLSLPALLLALSAPALAQVAPVPPLMNFQGRLAKPDGTPLPDGTYTVTLSLYDALAAGNQVWTETETVTTHNGMFAATLGSVTPLTDSVFSNPVWLEIQVGMDAPLAPRRQLVTVAHAFKADVALSVPDLSITDAKIANVDFSKITNFPVGTGGGWNLTGNSGLDPATNFLGTTDLTPLIFMVNNRRAMRYDYAENTYTSGPLNGQNYRGINVLGGSELNTITGAVGATIAGGGRENVGSATLPNAISADFGTIGGGYNNLISAYDATISGGVNNTITAAGAGSMIPGGTGNRANGAYSFAAGTNAAANNAGSFVWADNQSAVFSSSLNNSFNVRAYGGLVLEGGADFTTYLSSTSGDKNRFLNLINSPQTPVAAGIRAGGVLVADSYGYASVARNNLVVKGFVGIGIPTPTTTLDVNGIITSRGTDFILKGRGGGVGNNGGLGRALVDNGASGLVINFANDFGGVVIGSNTTVLGTMNVNGVATAHKVQIVGGSDVAEPYNIAAAGGIAPLPGYVVAIDRARVGQMRVADKAYDTTVSGIISGANGVEPGITLTQKGTVADGSLPVASVGRVWCWCDADAGGAITAGDLLTTSATAGHAMRANDAGRERGAILGKAMSPLSHGRGLVLVLVTLQ